MEEMRKPFKKVPVFFFLKKSKKVLDLNPAFV